MQEFYDIYVHIIAYIKSMYVYIYIKHIYMHLCIGIMGVIGSNSLEKDIEIRNYFDF